MGRGKDGGEELEEMPRKNFDGLYMYYAGAGAYAGCTYCTHIGEHSKTLQKIIYPGNRSFLNKDDNLRLDASNFPEKGVDLADPPEIKTMEYVNQAIANYTAEDSNEAKKKLFQEAGCKGPYALSELSSHDRISNTPVDPMHLIKNIVAHCVNLIAGHEDSHKVRAEEERRKRFPEAWISDHTQNKLPPSPFSLSKEDVVVADERAQRVLVPADFDWHPKTIFGKNTGMKAHEWKQIASNGVLKFCLRGMLGRSQRKTLYLLFDTIRDVCANSINTESIDELEQQVHRVLALVERDFPVSMQVIVFHLFHHIPMFLKRFGPVHSFWMYNFERFNSWITRRVLNRRYPEATVTETYRITAWAQYLELSGQLSKGAIIYNTTDEDNGEDEDSTLSHSGNNIFVLTSEQVDSIIYLRFLNLVTC